MVNSGISTNRAKMQVFITENRYIANIFSVTEAVERLRHSNVNNQMFFHTENGLWAESAEYIADRYYEEERSQGRV